MRTLAAARCSGKKQALDERGASFIPQKLFKQHAHATRLSLCVRVKAINACTATAAAPSHPSHQQTTHLHCVGHLRRIRHLAHPVAQQLPQRAQQLAPLAVLCVHRLVQQPVGAKLSVGPRQSLGVQDGQLGLALVVLCVVAILQGRTRVSLIHLIARGGGGRGGLGKSAQDFFSRSVSQE